MIVDSLRVYKQPVFVYLPRGAELRGGAWVVVDPTINPDMMEMYADTNSRGGVLEPEGTVQVKFRRKMVEQVMARLDPQYAELQAECAQKALSPEQQAVAAEKLEARYVQLAPIYHQVSVKFADLHDTPGRMKAKGCINDIVPWPQARSFFFWRLKRRLLEAKLCSLVKAADPTQPIDQVLALLKRSFASSAAVGRTYLWEDNKAVSRWIEEELDGDELRRDSRLVATLKSMHQEHVLDTIKRLAGDDQELVFNSVLTLMEMCSKSQIAQIRQSLDDKGSLQRPGSATSLQSLGSL